MAWSQGGSAETPPRWHVTIYFSISHTDENRVSSIVLFYETIWQYLGIVYKIRFDVTVKVIQCILSDLNHIYMWEEYPLRSLNGDVLVNLKVSEGL